MKNAIFRRVAAAFAANLFGRGVSVLTQIASPALFLWCWGVELYGQWLVLAALPGMLAACDFGFCSAAANDMTLRMTRNDTQGAKTTFQYGLGFALTTGGLAGLIALTVTMGGDAAAAFNLTTIDKAQAQIILAILILQVIIGLPGELLMGGFRSCHRFAEGLTINNSMLLAELIFIATLLLIFRAPIAVAAVMLVFQCARLVILAVVMRRRLGWASLPPPLFSWGEWRRLLSPALGFAAALLSRIIMNQGMVVLLGVFIVPAAVVGFTTARTAARLTATAADLMISSILAELSVAWACNRHDLLRILTVSVMRIALWTGSLCIIIIIFFVDFLEKWWLHDAVHLSKLLMFLLSTAELFYSLGRAGFVLASAANRHAVIAFRGCLISLGGLAAAAILVGFMGVEGAAAAALIIELSIMAFTLRCASHLAGFSLGGLLVDSLAPPWRGLSRQLAADETLDPKAQKDIFP